VRLRAAFVAELLLHTLPSGTVTAPTLMSLPIPNGLGLMVIPWAIALTKETIKNKLKLVINNKFKA